MPTLEKETNVGSPSVIHYLSHSTNDEDTSALEETDSNREAEKQ